MKKKILSFGEILWDILPNGRVLGGAPFNFAYRVNSLGDKGIFISRLGKDEQGEKAFKMVKSLGIDTSYLQWDERYPTGTVIVSFDEMNNPDYVIVPVVAYDNIEMTAKLKSTSVSADCLYFGTLVQRSFKTRLTLEKLIEVSKRSVKLLDINLRKECYTLESIIWSLHKADIIKLNNEETILLSEILSIGNKNLFDFCSEIIDKYSLLCCIVTLGDKGAFALSDNGDKVYVPGYKVNLEDSLGSGDAFAAGFIHNYLNGFSLRESCELGNILGGICATQKGATQIINSEMIEEFKNVNTDRLYLNNLKKYSD